MIFGFEISRVSNLLANIEEDGVHENVLIDLVESFIRAISMDLLLSIEWGGGVGGGGISLGQSQNGGHVVGK